MATRYRGIRRTTWTGPIASRRGLLASPRAVLVQPLVCPRSHSCHCMLPCNGVVTRAYCTSWHGKDTCVPCPIFWTKHLSATFPGSHACGLISA